QNFIQKKWHSRKDLHSTDRHIALSSMFSERLSHQSKLLNEDDKKISPLWWWKQTVGVTLKLGSEVQYK
ncbi:hypothetical protein ACE4Z7_25360, partial [Salmonella enterica]|uniref:hypothetical protein n=1 Tax=Salmonella enterica TaxID=28901 RepID=UPI003D28F46E